MSGDVENGPTSPTGLIYTEGWTPDLLEFVDRMTQLAALGKTSRPKVENMKTTGWLNHGIIERIL